MWELQRKAKLLNKFKEREINGGCSIKGEVPQKIEVMMIRKEK